MVSIAILGYGTVGNGVAEIINKNSSRLKANINKELVLKKILVKDIEKHREQRYFNLLTEDIEDIFLSKIDIVIEAMGGLNPAYDYVKRALKLKKNVVTANKDLIAEYGDELMQLAHLNGVEIRFEASVGGGMPILKPLSECLIGNRIESVKAILNGTTNFILSKMSSEAMGYDNALKIAQDVGFAEANPESDVMGYDTARKLSILSTIAFSKKIDWKKINIKGITDIDKYDIQYAKREGYNIKLVAISKFKNEKIYAAVSPVMVRQNSILGKTDDEFNAVVVEGDSVGEVVFTGKGAGKSPTASAVFSDIVDILQKKLFQVISFDHDEACVDTLWDEESKWLLRIRAKDRIGTMKKIAGYFSDCEFKSRDLGCNEKEVVVCIKCKNEAILNKNIEELCSSEEIIKVKKLLILEG